MAMRKRWLIPMLLLAAVFIAVGGAIVTLVNTEWGRRQIAGVAESRMASLLAPGVRLTIGRLDGGLGGAWRAESLTLSDAGGTRVVSVGEVSLQLDQSAMLRGEIRLGVVTVRGVRANLEQLADGSWNVAHLVAPRPPAVTAPGPRRTVVADSIAIRDARVTVASLDTNAKLPRVRRTVDRLEASLGHTVFSSRDSAGGGTPLRAVRATLDSPSVTLVNASGAARWWTDSLRVDLASVRLPHSSATATGTVRWGKSRGPKFAVEARADSVGFADLAWASKRVPSAGALRAVVAVRAAEGGGAAVRVSNLTVRSGESAVTGSLSLVTGRRLEVRDVALDVAPLDVALIRSIAGDSVVPRAWQGGLRAHVRASGGSLDSLVLDTVSLAYDDRRVAGGGARASLSGALDASTRVVRFIGMTIAVDTLAIRTLGAVVPVADSLHGSLSGRVVLDGPVKDLRFSGLSVRHMDGDRPRSTLHGDGRIASARGGEWLDASLTVDTLALATLLRDRTTAPIRGAVNGTVRVRATADTMTITVGVQAGDGRIDVTGRTLLDSARASLQLTGAMRRLDPRHFLARGDIPASSLSGSIVVQLDTEDGHPDRHVAIHLDSTTTLGNSRILGGALRFGTDATGFHLDTAAVDADSWRLRAKGTLARTGAGATDSVTFSADVDSLGAMRTLLLDSAGAPRFAKMDGALRVRNGVLRGSFESAALIADVNATRVHVGDATIGMANGLVNVADLPHAATGTFRGTLDTVSTGGVAFRHIGTSVDLANGERASVSASAEVSDSLRIETVARVSWPDNGFRIAVDSLTGTTGSSRWSLRRPAIVTTGAGSFGVDSLIIAADSAVSVDVRGRFADSGPSDLRLRLNNLTADQLRWVATLPPDVNGAVSGTVSIGGTRDAPRIEADLQTMSVTADEKVLGRAALKATYADKRLTASADVRSAGGGSLTASATLPIDLTMRSVEHRLPEGGLTGDIAANAFSLAGFDALTKSVDSLAGTIDGHVTLGGSLRRPSGTGSLRLSDGAIDVNSIGFSARKANALLDLKGDTLFVRHVGMRDDDAASDTAYLSGTLFFTGERWTDWKVAMQSRAARFRVVDEPRLASVEASWNVGVTGTLGTPIVTGNVSLPYGVFTIGGARRARTATEGRGAAKPGVPQLNGVRVTLGSDVRLKSKEANVQLVGDVELFGVMDWPWVSGMVSATRGTYRVAIGPIVRTFRVDSGSVVVEGDRSMSPALDIWTTYVVRRADKEDVNITAHLYGTTQSPRLELKSDLGSAVAQSEIISYLVFGQPSFGVPSSGSSLSQTGMAAIIPSVGGWLEGTLGTVLPFFSTLQVTPTVSGDMPTNVAASPLESVLNRYALTAGRQLGTDSFLTLSGGKCSGSRVASTSSSPFWAGASIEYRPKRAIGAAFSVDPGSAPCSRAGAFGENYQLGLDLSYEWKFGRRRP